MLAFIAFDLWYVGDQAAYLTGESEPTVPYEDLVLDCLST